MRIALVIENAEPHRGGAQGWTFEFARHLLARGHEVHVVAQQFAPEALAMPIVPHTLGRCRSRAQFAAVAERCVRSLPVDIVHDMGAGWYGDVFQPHDGSRRALWHRKLDALPAWLGAAKRLWMRFSPRYEDYRRVLRRQFRESWTLLAMSEVVADDFVRFDGAQAGQIQVVHHGVDVERFAPERCRALRGPMRQTLGASDDAVLFLFAGHDLARKGLATAIAALGRMHAPAQISKTNRTVSSAAAPSSVERARHARLIVLGRARQKRHFERLARCAGVAGAVVFVGPQTDPLPYYAAADALVLPTRHEPFGLVILEAAACGLPVITTRRAGASELMESGREGYLLSDPHDDRTLAEQMTALLDPQKRDLMGAAARAMALRHPFEVSVDKILAIYNQIPDQRREEVGSAAVRMPLGLSAATRSTRSSTRTSVHSAGRCS